VTVQLDAVLKARVREVLDSQSVTDSVLRKLSEEGSACALILEARLARSESRLAELSSDPASSLAEIAAEARAINEVRPDLDELRELLADLDAHARALRASWISV
jgi:GTP1/Obg family GTP-binding protein